jgi:hypothetical protein
MWLSLEMGSSSEGISCFFRFLVRLVTTCTEIFRQAPLSLGAPGNHVLRHGLVMPHDMFWEGKGDDCSL